jgi:hypothetical protein
LGEKERPAGRERLTRPLKEAKAHLREPVPRAHPGEAGQGRQKSYN